MRAALMQLRAGRMDFVLSRCATRALVLGILFLHALPAELVAAPKAVVLQIDGAIGPAVADYVVRELRGISQVDTRLVVLRMNTPGGLDTSMREIIRAILSSPLPVAAYVAPSGARAASLRSSPHSSMEASPRPSHVKAIRSTCSSSSRAPMNAISSS